MTARRWRSHGAWLVGALFATAGHADEQEWRPFTVGTMVQTQGVGEALFEPHGERLMIEKSAAYETAHNFSWERVWGRDRTSLLDVDVANGGMREVSTTEGEHVWLGSFSPGGTRAAVGWFDGDQAKGGVYDFASHALRKFQFLVSNESSSSCAFDCPLWVSEEEFIHFTLSPQAQKKELSRSAYTDDAVNQWAHESWAGKESRVKVTGSGRYQSNAVEEGGHLIKVNALTGRTTTLAEGRFIQYSLSPDRKHFVVLRETGNLPIAGLEAKAVYGADKVYELIIFDTTSNKPVPFQCPTCNVTQESLRWSPSGKKLFFSTRISKEGQQKYEYHILDLERGRMSPFTVPSLPPGAMFDTETDARANSLTTPFVWMDDKVIAIRASKRAATDASREAKANKQDVRFDWYALSPGHRPVNMTAGLAPTQDRRRLEQFLTVHRGALFLLADGHLLRLSPDGTRKDLTPTATQALAPWCSVVAYWRDAGVSPACEGIRVDSVKRAVDAVALEHGWLTFRVVDNIADQTVTDELMFLNVDSGEVRRVRAPSVDAQLIAASPLAGAVLYRMKESDGDRLMLSRVGESKPTELWRFNKQLAGIAGGTPVMIKRREVGESEDRIDWLLLPPGHRSGDRHPLLVYFYPDKQYTAAWRSDDLRSVSFLNQHLPAGRGYAVLLASMRISSWEEHGNPMLEMHDQLIHAAENVVVQGYADPTRWALMGHSYGGYGTNCVITQTDRFKAAISLDGLANLSSGYAVGVAVERATSVAAGLAFGVTWSEGGQGRMGVPLWKDPDRYVRNSPVFSADKVHTPLMLIHGEDDFVNVGQAEEMFNALHRQGKDAIFVRYWGEEHVYGSPANMRDMWNRIFAWLDEHLDVSRDARGSIEFDGHDVKSRQGKAALRPEDFARLDPS